MPALSAQHLRKSFGPQVVLDDATFTLPRGEKIGLIGANGSGKSTLAKILAGVEKPDGGTLSVRRGLTIRYLAQEPELDPHASARAVVEEALTAWTAATVRHGQVTSELAAGSHHAALVEEQAELDDAIMRLGGWERGHEALGFLDQLGVREVDRPCGERSGGERRRIALAQLLVASPDIAILDEPTNHLDADTAAWLEGFLAKDFAGAIVLVTHDRYFLDAIVQRIVEIERGRLVSYSGGYGDYLARKSELMAHEERVEQNRQNILRREREWLSRGPKARSTKQKARIQRAHELEARGSATAGRPGEVSLITASSQQQGKTILELRGLEVAPAPGSPPLNAPLDLIVPAGERIGIVGPNGIGKTTLMRAILAAADEARRGERNPSAPYVVAGAIVVGKNTRTAYLDQARAKLDDDKSIFDDVRGEGGGTVVNLGFRGMESMDLRSYLELFLFDGQKQRQKVGSLSGGERARVALAKVLREGANLLMFDEPTNDLDLPDARSARGDAHRLRGLGARRHARSRLPRSSGDGHPRLRGRSRQRRPDARRAIRRRLRGLHRAAGRPPFAAVGVAEALRRAEEREGRRGGSPMRRRGARAPRAAAGSRRPSGSSSRRSSTRSTRPTSVSRRSRRCSRIHRSIRSAATRSRACRASSPPHAKRPRGSRSGGKRSRRSERTESAPAESLNAQGLGSACAAPEAPCGVPQCRSQFVIALLYSVVIAGAFTQNEWALPVVQSMSELHPAGMQVPAEQMLVGGLQSVSFVHWIEHVPVAVTHVAIGFRSDCTQSAFVVQASVLQRCVVASHDLPAAQSRSLAHVK